jgi:ABC-2 type transport system permease protein
MGSLSLILQTHLRKILHHLYPFRWKNYFPLTALLLLGFSLLAAEYAGFNKIFRYMNQLKDFPLFFVEVLLERFVALIFLICYSMIFMSSMINGLGSFYLSADLPMLFTLPIQRWKILAVKFVENWLTSCYLVLFFLATFLLSHGHSFHSNWRQFIFAVVILIFFTLSPVALGTAVVTLLIRYFPVRRIHQLVTLVAVVFLGSLIIVVRMMQPERLLHPSNTDDFVRLMKDLAIPSFDHLPSSWAANAIVYGDAAKILWLFLFASGSLVFLFVILHLLYQKAFVFSQESRSLRSNRAKLRKKQAKAGRIVSLVTKDARIFARDATQWSQMLLLIALVIVYLMNIKNLAIQLPMVRWVVSFINLGLAGFVLAALSVRFLFPSVSMEGRSFWIIRTLPVSFRTLLWCKYLIYFPPFLLFTQMLVYFSNRILMVPDFFLYLSMLNILAVAFALTGLAIGIGALMPSFKSDHPSKIAVGPGGVLYMLLSFVYLSLMLMLQIRPVWQYVIRGTQGIHNLWYFAAAILLTIIVAFLPMEWGARRLATREY